MRLLGAVNPNVFYDDQIRDIRVAISVTVSTSSILFAIFVAIFLLSFKNNIVIFLALAQEDDILILNPSYKALIGGLNR